MASQLTETQSKMDGKLSRRRTEQHQLILQIIQQTDRHLDALIMLVSLIRCGHGGVAGEEAEAVSAAGAGLHLTGTCGGRTAN